MSLFKRNEVDVYDSFCFLIDGESSKKYVDLTVPNEMTSPEPKFYEYDEVLGRDGSFITSMQTYSNQTKSYTVYFFENEKWQWGNRYRKLRDWIFSFNDNSIHELSESSDLQWFNKISKITISNLDRSKRWYSKCEIEFTLKPYDYAVSGQKWYSWDKVLHNPFYTCAPLWQITNTSNNINNFTLKVNGTSFVLNKVYPNETVYVDTDLVVTYQLKGDTRIKRARSGEEESLCLGKGINTISFTPASGFNVKIMPRWRSV